MAEFEPRTLDGYQAGAGARADIDEGLRAYMLRVYNYMASGLAITGIVAYLTSTLTVTTNPAEAVAQLPNGTLLNSLGSILYGPFQFALFAVILIMAFMLPRRVHKMSVGSLQIGFWIFAGLFGLVLSSVFLQYTGESITRVFFITAAAFGGLSLYGYTTKRDLGPLGAFCAMGLFGLLIAIVVSWFIDSSALEFAIAVVGVLIFAGLTAYDTQSIKEMYYQGDSTAVAGRKSIMGAFRLYLDFINLFLMLLMLFGNRE